MNIERQIEMAEKTTAGALLPWMLRSAALNIVERDGIVATAQSIGAPPAIVDGIKAAVSAGTGAVLGGGSGAVSAFIETASSQSLLLRMVADRAVRRAPFDRRLLVSATSPTGSMVPEGEAIPVSSFDFEGQMLAMHKAAAMVVTTEELWRDIRSPGQQLIIGALRAAVARAADAWFFTTTLAPTALGALSVDAALAGLLGAVHTEPGARLYWATSTAAANQIAALRDPMLTPLAGTMLGLPTVISASLTGKQVALVDGSGLAVELDQIAVDASDAATLEMHDTPTADSTTPTAAQLVSMFQSDSIAARAILYLGGLKLRAGAAAVAELT